MIFSDFLRFFFCTSKKRQLLAQVPRTSDHDSSVSRANSFAAQDESSKCRFPLSCLVAAITFPHTKWLKKITDHRDTAALKVHGFFGNLIVHRLQRA